MSSVREDLGYVRSERTFTPPKPSVKGDRPRVSVPEPVDFGAMVGDIVAAAADHAASCTLRECIRCGRHTCPTCPPAVKVIRQQPGQCEACIVAGREAEHAREWRHACDDAIPPRFKSFELKDPTVVTLVGREAHAMACRAAGDGERDIVLVGEPGAGKTVLACAILRAWGKRAGLKPAFAAAMDLARAAAEHPLGQGQAPAVAAAIRASVLVLDDLGQESDAYRSDVEYVIACRHNLAKPTIFTTFLDGTGIGRRYGGGVGRRVYDKSVAIVLEGP